MIIIAITNCIAKIIIAIAKEYYNNNYRNSQRVLQQLLSQ